MPTARSEVAENEAAVDALLGALADERRRRVVEYFRTADADSASVAELVDHAADRDGETGPRERLAVRLHHVTLPKLEAAGIVAFDHEGATVRYRGGPLAGRLLDAASGVETR
ncbi:MAG: hypothetical protein ABEJ31_08970 [Haloarculaceae archaeon]